MLNTPTIIKHNTPTEDIGKIIKAFFSVKGEDGKPSPNAAVEAHFTFIPLDSSNVPRKKIETNISDVSGQKIYNLCAAAFQGVDILTVPDPQVQKSINMLLEKTRKHPSFKKLAEANPHILAAMACTIAVSKAITSRYYAVEESLGPDLSTQATAIEVIKILLGDHGFEEFARQVAFQTALWAQNQVLLM